MITYLGSKTIGAGVPLAAQSIKASIDAAQKEVISLAQDALALQSILAGLQGDVAALQTEAAAITGLISGLVAQIAGGPAAVIAAIEAAIANILSGAMLAGLQQVLLGGPAAILSSMQAALAQAEATHAGLLSRIASAAARIASVTNDIAALAQRVAALQDLLNTLGGYQTTLAAAGVHAYVLTGPVSSMGSELEFELANGPPGGGPGDIGSAVLFVTTVGTTWSAMQATFGVI